MSDFGDPRIRMHMRVSYVYVLRMRISISTKMRMRMQISKYDICADVDADVFRILATHYLIYY